MIWEYMMTTYFDKRQLAESVDTPFAPRIMIMLKEISEAAYRLTARPSSEVEVCVTDEEGRVLCEA